MGVNDLDFGSFLIGVIDLPLRKLPDAFPKDEET